MKERAKSSQNEVDCEGLSQLHQLKLSGQWWQQNSFLIQSRFIKPVLANSAGNDCAPLSQVKVVSNVPMCPFPGDTLLSDNVSECFCKERFFFLDYQGLSCVWGAERPQALGDGVGVLLGAWGSATNKGNVIASLFSCCCISDYTAFYFIQSLVNFISSSIW